MSLSENVDPATDKLLLISVFLYGIVYHVILNTIDIKYYIMKRETLKQGQL